MTEVEAIKYLQMATLDDAQGEFCELYKEMCEMSINALEKQIPKRPDLEGDGYCPDGNLVYDTWICPNCEKHYEVDYDNYDYCPNCGQKIDWSNDLGE